MDEALVVPAQALAILATAGAHLNWTALCWTSEANSPENSVLACVYQVFMAASAVVRLSALVRTSS